MTQPPIRMPMVAQQSLPSILGRKKRIITQDDSGVEKAHMVDDRTMKNVIAVIEAAERDEHLRSIQYQQQTGGIGMQSSMGSLPSAGSHYSSSGSVTSGYNTIFPRYLFD